MSMAVRDRHVRVYVVGEETARAFFGQVKTDGRACHGRSGFVGDFDGERARAARPWSVYRPLALDDADVKNGDLSRRRATERQEQRRCGKGSKHVSQPN
jgi:hypothetical protein